MNNFLQNNSGDEINNSQKSNFIDKIEEIQSLLSMNSYQLNINNEKKLKKSDVLLNEILSQTPSDIKNKLDEYVVGQEEAKRMISMIVINHYRQIRSNQTLLPKTNVLLQGPTGCGKTYLIENLARIISVPFVTVDATSLTESGYEGENVDDIFSRLLSNANNDLEVAQLGIVYIDEIDKIARIDTTKDIIGREGVQQALLKIIEGTDVPIRSKNPFNQSELILNTKNILFILSGAFVGIEKLSTRSENTKNIGFIKNDQSNTSNTCSTNKLEHSDFIKYGMIPEFMGRISIILELKDLGYNEYEELLFKSPNSFLNRYREYLNKDGIEVVISKKDMGKMVEIAMNKNVGVRGLISVLQNKMIYEMYNITNENKKIKIKFY